MVYRFVVGHAPTEGATTHERDHFWNALDSVIAGVPGGDHLLVLMANERTGVQTVRCSVHADVTNISIAERDYSSRKQTTSLRS